MNGQDFAKATARRNDVELVHVIEKCRDMKAVIEEIEKRAQNARESAEYLDPELVAEFGKEVTSAFNRLVTARNYGRS